MQQLLLGQQPLIELIDSLEALLDRRDHLLLLKQGDACTGLAFVSVTLTDFRATLRLTVDPESPGERVFSYWNNEAFTPES